MLAGAVAPGPAVVGPAPKVGRAGAAALAPLVEYVGGILDLFDVWLPLRFRFGGGRLIPEG